MFFTPGPDLDFTSPVPGVGYVPPDQLVPGPLCDALACGHSYRFDPMPQRHDLLRACRDATVDRTNARIFGGRWLAAGRGRGVEYPELLGLPHCQSRMGGARLEKGHGPYAAGDGA